MGKIDITTAKERLSTKLQSINYGLSSISHNDNEEHIFSSSDAENIEYVKSYGCDTNDALYIFKTNDNKMVLCPSDDNLKEIVGVFNGSSDMFNEELQENIKAFFDSLAIDVESYQKSDHDNEDIVYGDSSFKANWEKIDPILPYKWFQGNGFYSGYQYYINNNLNADNSINFDSLYTGASSTKKGYNYYGYTCESYPYNKYFWFRDYLNEYLNNNQTKKITINKITKTATGNANYSFTWTADNSYELSRFSVYVGSTKWTKVTTLDDSSNSTTNRKEYTLTMNSSYVITVTFGNGTYSAIPAKNSKIYLKYSYYLPEYYTSSPTPNENIKCIAGCSTIAISNCIAYWGQYGIKIRKNGQEQIKKYKVGSLAIAKKYTSIFSKDNRWWYLEIPALPAINEFNYDFADTYHIYYPTGTGSLAYHSATKISHPVKIDSNYDDTIYNSSSNPNGVTEALKTKRESLGKLTRYIFQTLNSTSPTPSSTGAYTYELFTSLKNKIKFGINNAQNSNYYSTFGTIDSFLSPTSSAFMRGCMIGVGGSNMNAPYYDASEFAMYRELSKGIPLIFSATGTSSSGSDASHAFNCDGYDPENDMWHFNFGWKGKGDGWFSLRVGNQISPSGSTYNNSRYIFYRFYPNEYYNDFIELSQNTVEFDNTGGEKTITVVSMEYYDDGSNSGIGRGEVTSSATWGFENLTNSDWMTISKNSAGTALNIVTTANNSTDKTGQIKVYKTLDNSIYEIIDVTLKGSDNPITYTLNISNDTLEFNNTGGSQLVTVTSNTTWTVEYDQSINWISYTINENILNITTSANDLYEQKTATIIIKTTNNAISKTITIILAAAEIIENPFLNLSNNICLFNASGGTESITVDSNVNWYISYNQPSWLTVEKYDNETILLTATQNEFNTQTCVIDVICDDHPSLNTQINVQIERSANIQYAELLIHICKFNSSGGTAIVNIETNTEWDITYTGSWFTVQKMSNGIKIITNQNSSQETKQATIYIVNAQDNSIIYDSIDIISDVNLTDLDLYKSKYLTLTFDADTTLSCTKQLYYKKDTDTGWTLLTANQTITFYAIYNSSVSLKGNNTPLPMTGIGQIKIKTTGECSLSGNIMSLLYSSNFENSQNTIKPFAFYKLFVDSDITDVSHLILPAPTLAFKCYAKMFQNCSKLTNYPDLSMVNNLYSYCFYDMFNGCKSLLSVPILSITTLASHCYAGMFANSGCTTVPQNMLPATQLATSCYHNMFKNCYNLVSVPQLPATSLVAFCYYAMFKNSGIVELPQLPNNLNAPYCCEQMFEGCKNIITE